MNILSYWEKIQPAIKEQIGQSAYNSWFSYLHIKQKNSDTIIVETPDEFFKNWIIEHYLNFINNILKTSDFQITLEFEVNPNLFQTTKQNQLNEIERNFQPSTTDKQKNSLNPRFSFDNFVVGSSNRFAHAACLAVAESPAKAYNPLFIYGGVGLGKTHLMQAIANKIQINDPSIKHSYLSSERFTNELIDAIKNRSTNQFRQKYRNIDVLLIDDIQFIAGKESTQEEFFHTFNTLHDNRKQIIISSDRPPKDIANLEERLSSRFAWGLITDIQPPDFETRVAILRKKLEKEPVNVPDDVITFIAEQITTNIRELEGALIRVIAYSLLEEKPVSLDIAKIILKDIVKEVLKSININLIQKRVVEYFNISLADIKERRRNKNIVLPRQIAMYLSRKLTNFSLPEIGEAFGGKDHTTVLHSCKKIEREIIKNSALRNILEKITNSIQH